MSIGVRRNIFIPQTGKTTAIRRTAFRGTGASRHYGGIFEGPLYYFSDHHSTIALRGLEGVIDWSHIMPRNAIVFRTADVIFFISGAIITENIHLLYDMFTKMRPRCRQKFYIFYYQNYFLGLSHLQERKPHSEKRIRVFFFFFKS